MLCSEPRRRASVVPGTNTASDTSNIVIDEKSGPSVITRGSAISTFISVSLACCSYDMNKFGRRAVTPHTVTATGSTITTTGGGVVSHGGPRSSGSHDHGHGSTVVGGSGVVATGVPTMSVGRAAHTAPTVSFSKLEGVCPDDGVVVIFTF